MSTRLAFLLGAGSVLGLLAGILAGLGWLEGVCDPRRYR